MTSNIRIFLRNISKCYGGRRLFDNITAGCEPGQCLAITGANGAGKSTLLKIVAGLLRPTSGQVSFLDENQHELDSDARLRCLAMVAPDMAMYTALSGVENILFWSRVRGFTYTAAQAERFCCEAGLESAGHEPVQAYSTGMRQRLKLAVGKALQPAIWLLDEPTSNLDTAGQGYVRQLIADALRGKAAVLLASNDPEEAGYADSKIEL